MAVDKHVHLIFGGLHLVTTQTRTLDVSRRRCTIDGKLIGWRRAIAPESRLLRLFAKRSVTSICTPGWAVL
jgi:hypothetical protein